MVTRILLGMCCIVSLIFVVGCASLSVVPTVPTGMIYTGSTGPVGIAVANYPDYTIIGPARGKSTAIGVLGIVGTGNCGASEAYQKALLRARADALIDVQVDQKLTSVLGLFTKHTTIVSGTAVKFK